MLTHPCKSFPSLPASSLSPCTGDGALSHCPSRPLDRAAGAQRKVARCTVEVTVSVSPGAQLQATSVPDFLCEACVEGFGRIRFRPNRLPLHPISTEPHFMSLMGNERTGGLARVGRVDAQLATSLDWLHTGAIRNSAGSQSSKCWPPAEDDIWRTHVRPLAVYIFFKLTNPKERFPRAPLFRAAIGFGVWRV
ncbi:hypothetical protein DFH06DRAFT_1311192 [Mycena polygramma]|nr:hypothetical protein DFH06DRAFT_1311192 [Mycena polygramma]